MTCNFVVLCLMIFMSARGHAMRTSQEGWSRTNDEIPQSPRKNPKLALDTYKLTRTQSGTPQDGCIQQLNSLFEPNLRAEIKMRKKDRTKSVEHNLSPRHLLSQMSSPRQQEIVKGSFDKRIVERKKIYKDLLLGKQNFNKDIFTEKTNKINKFTSRDQIYSFFRESKGLKKEYAYLRFLMTTNLYEHFNNIYFATNLMFVNSGSGSGFSIIKEQYLSFLRNTLKPLAEHAPEEVRDIFRDLENSANQAQRMCLSGDEIDYKALSLTNFILFIVNPLLLGVPGNSFVFDLHDNEIKKIEKTVLKEKKLYKKRDSLRKEQIDAIIEEVALVLKTKRDSFQNNTDLEKRRTIVVLSRLLTKTFSSTQFDNQDPLRIFNEFIVTDAELEQLKNEMKDILFGGKNKKAVHFTSLILPIRNNKCNLNCNKRSLAFAA